MIYQTGKKCSFGREIRLMRGPAIGRSVWLGRKGLLMLFVLVTTSSAGAAWDQAECERQLLGLLRSPRPFDWQWEELLYRAPDRSALARFGLIRLAEAANDEVREEACSQLLDLIDWGRWTQPGLQDRDADIAAFVQGLTAADCASVRNHLGNAILETGPGLLVSHEEAISAVANQYPMELIQQLLYACLPAAPRDELATRARRLREQLDGDNEAYLRLDQLEARIGDRRAVYRLVNRLDDAAIDTDLAAVLAAGHYAASAVFDEEVALRLKTTKTIERKHGAPVPRRWLYGEYLESRYGDRADFPELANIDGDPEAKVRAIARWATAAFGAEYPDALPDNVEGGAFFWNSARQTLPEVSLPPLPSKPEIISTGRVVFVHSGSQGTPDGGSWATAYRDLQAALDAARPGDQVWVGAGVYRPRDRGNAHFRFPDGVEIVGGFGGTETRRDERDWRQRQTIVALGPEPIDQQHAPGAHSTVYVAEALGGCIVDGLTIMGAGEELPNNSSFYFPEDGLLRAVGSAVVLRNCTFVGSRGNQPAVSATSSWLLFENCSFVDNSGGALLTEKTTVLARRCLFRANGASGARGTLRCSGAHVRFEACRFVDNIVTQPPHSLAPRRPTAEFREVIAHAVNCVFANTTVRYPSDTRSAEAVVNAGESRLTVVNCTFSPSATPPVEAVLRAVGPVPCRIHNSIVQLRGAALAHAEVLPVVTYSSVSGGFQGVGNIASEPRFRDPEKGDFRLLPGSPCINAGTAGPDVPSEDMAGRPRDARPDIGAYEFVPEDGQ